MGKMGMIGLTSFRLLLIFNIDSEEMYYNHLNELLLAIFEGHDLFLSILDLVTLELFWKSE